MKFAIVVFPGSNCDRDCGHVVSEVLGHEVAWVWHRDTSLPDDVDAVIVPGGFSYGDYLRAGAVAKLSPVMDAVTRFAEEGGPVIGICNGFQILLEAGLLPGAMLRNDTLRFVCKPVEVEVVSARTPFTSSLETGTSLDLPIANAEGNYFIDADGLAELEAHDQIVFRYRANPNGSVGDIAGVCNRAGNVVGLMPHPERASEAVLGSTDGLAIFESVIQSVGGTA